MPVPEAVGSSVRSICEPGASEDSSEERAAANSRQASVTFARRSAVVGSSSRMLSFDSPAALSAVMIAHLSFPPPYRAPSGAGRPPGKRELAEALGDRRGFRSATHGNPHEVRRD